MLADNNSPFFAVVVQYAIFSTVKAFPSKDIFGCSHCPIPVTAWPSADLHLHKVRGYTRHLWNVHGMRLLKSTDCYDFTGCEIITNLERLPSSHCPFNVDEELPRFNEAFISMCINIFLATPCSG